MSHLTRYKQSCPKCGKSFMTSGGVPLPADEQCALDLLARTQDKRTMLRVMLEHLRADLRCTLSGPVASEALAASGTTAAGIEAEWAETLPCQLREILQEMP